MRRHHADTREASRQLIAAGRVTVGGAPALKATRLVSADESIELRGPARRFVSRGGDKLAAALVEFGIECTGRRVLDAGASTGGFTDCVLQGGAAQVHSVDVGYGQLHDRLRRDPRVVCVDRTNIRDVTAESLGGAVDLVVADLSFVSLSGVTGPLVGSVVDGGDVVVLVKPQFEVDTEAVTAGRGVITDPELWRDALATVIAAFDAAGADMMGSMVSPLHGAEGNTEFLVHFRPRPRESATN